MRNLLQKEYGLTVHPKLTITIYDFVLSDIMANVYFYKSRHKELSTIACDENPDVLECFFTEKKYLNEMHLFNFSRNVKRNFVSFPFLGQP